MDGSFLFLLCYVVILVKCQYIFLTTATSWWKAERGCQEAGGKLYIPPTLQDDLLINVTDPGETYWLGALTYPSLIWTSDNTSLYTYKGYQPTLGIPSFEFDGNSAINCHLTCGDMFRIFALQESKCYCLSDTRTDNEDKGNRCPGNFEDFCGDENGVSVYEIFSMDVLPLGQCFYAEKHSGDSMYFTGDTNCSTERFMAGTEHYSNNSTCHNGVCVTHQAKEWDDWNTLSKLLKVDETNLQDLKSVMTEKTSDQYSYWIGLRQFPISKWINRTDASNISLPLSHAECCLAVSRVSDVSQQLIYAWKSCINTYKVVCETDEHIPASSLGTTDHTGTLETTSSQHTTSSEQTTSSTVTFSQSSISPTTERQGQIKEDRFMDIGLYVGISLACLVILGTVIVFGIIYRRKYFCFGGRQTTSTQSDTAVQSNDLYMSTINTQSMRRKVKAHHYEDVDDIGMQTPVNSKLASHQGYSHVISVSGDRTGSFLGHYQEDAKVNVDYYNWEAGAKHDQVTKTQNAVTRSENEESDYDVVGQIASKHNPCVNSYDHIGPDGRLSNRGTSLNDDITNSSEDYDHVTRNEVTKTDFTGETYSHIKTLDSDWDETDYDVVRYVAADRRVDDTYSHLHLADDNSDQPHTISADQGEESRDISSWRYF